MTGFGAIGRVVALVWVSPRTNAVVRHVVASVREGLMALSELSGGVADELSAGGEPDRSSLLHALRLCETTTSNVAHHLNHRDSPAAGPVIHDVQRTSVAMVDDDSRAHIPPPSSADAMSRMHQ